MPYCPKCDMEFVDGITVCSDCGGLLMESKEAADALKREEARMREEAFRKEQEAYEVSDGGEVADDFDENPDSLSSSPLPPERIKKEENRAYVSKRRRYEDMRSSISAFLSIGGIFLAFGILCWMKIIKLPLDMGPLIVFQTALTVMGIDCLIVAVVTKKSAADMVKAADVEDIRTNELVTWFANSYSASMLDEALLKIDPSLEGEELYLKRFELIQDHLIIEHDLPDPSYVDYLCEEIYGRVFEN